MNKHEQAAARIKRACQALSTLEELLALSSPSAVERDAAIQRFEYSFETFWKAARKYLMEIEGIECGSPKQVMRGLNQAGIINNTETILALEMVDDRNKTVHTYDEGLANEVFNRIKNYGPLMRIVLSRMEERL